MLAVVFEICPGNERLLIFYLWVLMYFSFCFVSYYNVLHLWNFLFPSGCILCACFSSICSTFQ